MLPEQITFTSEVFFPSFQPANKEVLTYKVAMFILSWVPSPGDVPVV